MATRSTIALEYANGQIDQVYCHWDGYLDHNGKLLLECYMNPFKVRTLIDFGDLSSLAEEVMPDPNDEHDFNNPQAGVCVFYGRDRRETGTDRRRFADFHDYKKEGQSEEYDYLLRQVDGVATWYVSDHGGEFKLLTDAVAAEALVAEEA